MPTLCHRSLFARRFAAGSLLAWACAGLCSAAGGQAKAGPACPSRPIVFGLYEFGRFYHDGAGLDKDIAELLAARSGCRFEYRVMMRGRIWQEMQGGSVDMTLSAIATAERKVFAWAVPYLWMKNMIILRKEVSPGIRSPADFIAAPNLRLGVARGHFPGKPFDGFVAQLRNIARVDEIDSTEQLYAMFKAGRFQAVLGTQLVYSQYLREDKVRIEDWAPALSREAANLLISKKHFSADDARRWGELMKELQADGSVQRMLERYVPPAEAARMLAP
jgi:polar amino acid transport system substrate-binding protein